MEIIGRDKITQTGNDSTIKIDNKKENKKHWYQTPLGQLVIAVVAIIIGALLTRYLGLT